MRRGSLWTYLPLAFLLLSACAAVDQFGERIYDGNRNSGLALNQETLVNILRASNLQPLNFVGISQVTGGQSEQLTTGLPTITIGPAQTVAQHQFQVANSVQSGVTGGYQASPLVSTAFSTGMLSPISPKTLAFLLATYPREPVLFSVVESLTLRSRTSGRLIRLTNDPTMDRLDDDGEDRCMPLAKKADGQWFTAADKCSYALFLNLLGRLTNKGLTAELIKSKAKPAVSSASKSGSGSDSSKPTDSAASFEGRFCFDPTKAVVATAQPICGTSGSATTVIMSFEDLGPVDLVMNLRSPTGVFNYYGQLLNRQPPVWHDYYYTYQGRNLIKQEPFLNVVRSGSVGCFVQVSYGNENYCVPLGSKHTALLMTLLVHLRNLNIQPTDLNSAFSVHLSGT